MSFMVAFLCLAPSRGRADGWDLDLTLGTRYDHGAQPAPEGDWVLSATPKIGYTRHAAQATWELDASRRFDSLKDDRSPRPSNDQATGRAIFTPDADTRLALRGYWYGTRDLVSGDPQVATVPGLTSDGWGDASASLWRGEASYGFRSRSHAAPEVQDGWSQNASATLFPVRSAAGAWLVGGSYQDWSMNDTLALSAVTGVVGFRRTHTPLLSSEVEVGVVETREPDGARVARAAWTLGMTGWARLAGLPLESHVRVSRGAALTGSAEVSRSVSGLGLTAGWKRSLEADGGAFDVPSVRDFATVGVHDSLSSGTVLSVQGSYGQWRPRPATGERIEAYRASGSVERPLSPWLNGRMTYMYLRQEHAAGGGFHRARFELGLTASFR